MPYASSNRVMFTMLFLTGCRLTCLDRMRLRNLHGEHLYWRPGKNQKGWRKERLPIEYLEELRAYRETHRVDQDRLFGIASETFRREFNRASRPTLGPAWRRKRPVMRNERLDLEYVYQLKGLRKDFQTLDFKRNYDELCDAGLAIEMTSKRMRHSSTKITARHYIENFDALGVKTLPSLVPNELLRMGQQKRLLDY